MAQSRLCPSDKRQKRPLLKRLRRAVLAASIITSIGAGGAVASCGFLGKDLENHIQEIPCEKLDLPEVEGAKELEAHLCVAVEGEQPSKIGIERRKLPDGRLAITMLPTWPHDGPFESLPFNRRQDIEPVTLVMAGQRPEELRVRSHWIVGRCAFDDMPKLAGGRVGVAFANGFHTPAPLGCEPEPAEPLDEVQNAQKGRRTVFKAVMRYAKAICRLFKDSFSPMDSFDGKGNSVPPSGHPARSQPLF